MYSNMSIYQHHVYRICKVNENKLKQGPIQAVLARCAGGQVIYHFMFIARDNYIVLNQLSQINMSHNPFSTSPNE